MTIFELIGVTARIDWASTTEKRQLGLFTSREKAESRIKKIKEDKEWSMCWDSFEIKELELDPDYFC
jgi:hypothetical protein